MKNFSKILFSALIATSTMSMAMDNEKDEKSKQTQPFKGDWTGTFNTKLGTCTHTPKKTILGFMASDKGIQLSGNGPFNGVFLTSDLDLKIDMTKEEFTKALRDSGLLN